MSEKQNRPMKPPGMLAFNLPLFVGDKGDVCTIALPMMTEENYKFMLQQLETFKPGFVIPEETPSQSPEPACDLKPPS